MDLVMELKGQRMCRNCTYRGVERNKGLVGKAEMGISPTTDTVPSVLERAILHGEKPSAGRG